MNSLISPSGRVESFLNDELMYLITHPGPHQIDFIIEAIVKVEGGVRFLCESLPTRPNAGLIFYRCNKYGEFSARPYLVGQSADDSTLSCVLGLYYDFCRRNGLNATKLLVRAYPEGERAESWDAVSWRTVLDAAQWQDTRFPDTWTREAILGLLSSLRNQRRTHLAAVLAEQLNLSSAAEDRS